jgi:hypothetical protein
VVLSGSSTARTKLPRTSATKDSNRIEPREKRLLYILFLQGRRGVAKNSRCSMSAANCLMASSEAGAIVGDSGVQREGESLVFSATLFEFRSAPFYFLCSSVPARSHPHGHSTAHTTPRVCVWWWWCGGCCSAPVILRLAGEDGVR